MPHNLDLCRLFGVRASSADPLDRDDLASARQTRMALHRELIKRRPGSYPRRWLAHRLGVTRRTVDTYNKLIPIHSRAMYHETSLNWGNIERLPLDEPLQGAFMETLIGKRYPALRPLAARLLAAGNVLRLKERTASFYWYGSEDPPLSPGTADCQSPPHEPVQVFLQCQPASHGVMGAPAVEKQAESKPVRPKRPPVLPNFHQPLPDTIQESKSVQLYDRFSQAQGKQLSLANARRLVHTYGITAVSNALHLVSSRKQVANPVGFLVTALKADLHHQSSAHGLHHSAGHQ